MMHLTVQPFWYLGLLKPFCVCYFNPLIWLSLAFMVPLIVETFSVVSHLLIWLPGSV